MIDTIRLLFIFSFAVIAFSQYLRTSSSSVVNELRNKSRSYDDSLRILCAGDEKKFLAKIGNEEYKRQRNILFSEDCEVSHDGIWFYLLLGYLSLIILFESFFMFVDFLEIQDNVEFLVLHKKELVGLYCFGGLVLNVLTFRSGLKAVKPRSEARKAHASLENVYRALTFTV